MNYCFSYFRGLTCFYSSQEGTNQTLAQQSQIDTRRKNRKHWNDTKMKTDEPTKIRRGWNTRRGKQKQRQKAWSKTRHVRREKNTGKNQSMTVFASNIQPFNWVIDLMRWTSWMRKSENISKAWPKLHDEEDVIETQELQWKYSDGSGCTNSFWVRSIFVLRCGSQTGSRIRTGLELQSCLFQEINLYSHSAPVSQRFACELC